MTVAEKIKALNDLINDAYGLLQAAKSECSHESGRYSYESNTGNWCPNDDSYWRHSVCDICGSEWRDYSEINGIKNPVYTQRLEGNWVEWKRVIK